MMQIMLPVGTKTLLTEATVCEDGTLSLKENTSFSLKPGTKVALTISLIAESEEENQTPLIGSVLRYNEPFEPATNTEDWEALRGC